jgi:hypothetical protein
MGANILLYSVIGKLSGNNHQEENILLSNSGFPKHGKYLFGDHFLETRCNTNFYLCHFVKEGWYKNFYLCHFVE